MNSNSFDALETPSKTPVAPFARFQTKPAYILAIFETDQDMKMATYWIQMAGKIDPQFCMDNVRKEYDTGRIAFKYMCDKKKAQKYIRQRFNWMNAQLTALKAKHPMTNQE